MKLVLVRHGKSVANLTRMCAGWYDTPLCEDGIEELQGYAKTVDYPKTDRYYSSDLSRAVDTFRILYGESTPLHEKTSAFREMGVGLLENTPWEGMEVDIFEELFGNNNPVCEGETVTHMSLRVFGKLTQILSDMKQTGDDSVTVVCHAGVIMLILTFLTPQPFNMRSEIETLNGRGYILDLDFNALDNHMRLVDVAAIPDK